MTENSPPADAPQGTSGATIDPPAADTARRARERRDALLGRLAEEETMRLEKKAELEVLLVEHEAAMTAAKTDVSVVPVS